MSLDWAVIGIPGFALLIGAWLAAPSVRDRNLRRARAARQWLTNRERGDKG